MGSVFNRGTKHAPLWYVKFKDAGGTWKMAPSHMPTKEQAKRWLAAIETRVAEGRVGIEPAKARVPVEKFLVEWSESLTNRDTISDKGRIKNHVLPEFASLTLAEITVPRIMAWLDRQRAAGKLSGQTIRHNLGLLSRFFSWCIERGLAETNPVRSIPVSRRPKTSPKRDVAFLDDDELIRKLIRELPAPIGLMFYLGNRSGLRTGEIAGLRMGDLAWLDENVIRVGHSYDGPLKEDRAGDGRVKWVPAPMDLDAVMGAHPRERLAARAGPTDLVFPCPTRNGGHFRHEYIGECWDKVRKAHNLKLTWYEATRHSCASRNLSRDATLDEVSSALGHSTPAITRRHYDHFIRRRFSERLRAGIGTDGGGEVVPLHPVPGRATTAQG